MLRYATFAAKLHRDCAFTIVVYIQLSFVFFCCLKCF